MAARGETLPLPICRLRGAKSTQVIAAFGTIVRAKIASVRHRHVFWSVPIRVIGSQCTVVLPEPSGDDLPSRSELALVVGQRAKDLPADERAGGTGRLHLRLDVAARGMGRIGPSRIGKAFDTFTPPVQQL